MKNLFSLYYLKLYFFCIIELRVLLRLLLSRRNYYQFLSMLFLSNRKNTRTDFCLPVLTSCSSLRRCTAWERSWSGRWEESRFPESWSCATPTAGTRRCRSKLAPWSRPWSRSRPAAISKPWGSSWSPSASSTAWSSSCWSCTCLGCRDSTAGWAQTSLCRSKSWSAESKGGNGWGSTWGCRPAGWRRWWLGRAGRWAAPAFLTGKTRRAAASRGACSGRTASCRPSRASPCPSAASSRCAGGSSADECRWTRIGTQPVWKWLFCYVSL